MRLWHKDLIEVLPRQQLLGQWRECCLIAKSIAENGTPNHLLVNKIMDYPPEHFLSYAKWVEQEMKRRGYKCDFNKYMKWYSFSYFEKSDYEWLLKENIFTDWHNDRYLKQCYFNLQEKYDCGGMSKDEWQAIDGKVLWTFVQRTAGQTIMKGAGENGRPKNKQD